ncbi:MAG: helix-turn-helix transcriptional regulator [Clostridia bacterium]|nr:helix-turn-helix transcriptional regulator [Clostridia bacterium]
MYQELLIQTIDQTRKVFLQQGFFQNIAPAPHLHKHNYTEIHLITGGTCRFSFGRDTCTVGDGEMLVIPPKLLHCCMEQDPSVRHHAFQMDCPAEDLAVYSLSPALISEFFRQIEAKDFSIISAFIALLYSYFDKGEKSTASASTDDGFLIQEFFFHRYNEDVHLSDLAEILHRSERQTERLVLAHTGNTFREELTATRIAIARYLQSTSDLSLHEIAEYVGYRSYAGFWKALQKKNAMP